MIDRLWPRGISKAAARIDYWAKTVAPSAELRRWFQHEPEKWPEFRRRYFAELKANPQGLEELRSQLGDDGLVTIVYGAKEERYNNAVALCEFLGR